MTWVEADKPDVDDIEGFWEPLRNAAVSCGAFAFAFRVIDVIQHASEFVGKMKLQTQIAPTQSFSYTDGGTFQNEPLGLAKDLVDLIDKHLDVESRFYLFVAPGAKSSTANSEFNADKANYRETALRLASSIFEQSRFQDWITAKKVNEQIALFNRRAEELHRVLGDGTLDPNAVIPGAAALLPLLFSNNQTETQAAAWERLQQQFAPEYRDLLGKRGKPAANAFIDTLLTLETAAQLGERDEMTIYGITAQNSELASYEISAFAGFFDRRYRDHDYDIGREKAQAFLANPGALGPIRFAREPVRPIDRSLNGLKLEMMSREIREKVRDRLRDRAHEILKEAGVDPWLIGGAVREAIDLAFIKPPLDKLLKL